MLALETLDEMLGDETTLEALREGLQKAMDRDPVWFFRRIIMPLLPKEATLSLENEGAIEWVSLSTMIRTRDKNRSTLPKNASALSAPDGDSVKPSALPPNC
jgi:hypothetical protein